MFPKPSARREYENDQLRKVFSIRKLFSTFRKDLSRELEARGCNIDVEHSPFLIDILFKLAEHNINILDSNIQLYNEHLSCVYHVLINKTTVKAVVKKLKEKFHLSDKEIIFNPPTIADVRPYISKIEISFGGFNKLKSHMLDLIVSNPTIRNYYENELFSVTKKINSLFKKYGIPANHYCFIKSLWFAANLHFPEKEKWVIVDHNNIKVKNCIDKSRFAEPTADTPPLWFNELQTHPTILYLRTIFKRLIALSKVTIQQEQIQVSPIPSLR